MVSIREKAAISVIIIVVALSVANFATSYFFTSARMTETIEKNLRISCDIGDDLISTRIIDIKHAAQMAADELSGVSRSQWEMIMRRLVAQNGDFLALTIFARDEALASYGEPPTPYFILKRNPYLSRAFDGESVISTTYIDYETDQLVIYVCVPMENDRILSATLPGMLFSEMLSRYRLGDNGNVFMVDEEGTMIANFRDYMVLERYNAIKVGNMFGSKDTAGTFISEVIKNESGSGVYVFENMERICSYKSISGTDTGWKIAVISRLNENAISTLFNGLLASALVFLILGITIAFVFSDYIAKPFYQIQEQKVRLEELNITAQAASNAKTSFLANMSHEMRTPLNAVIGLSELARGMCESIVHDDKEEIIRNLDKINSAGLTLLGLVNDILDISKIEAGKFELVPVDYDTSSLINDTITLNILRIGEKPIKFTLDVDETLPATLKGDELRVREILNNLLSNAFKYTREGTVSLRVTCERDELNVVWFIAVVRDTGSGIQSESLQNLFSDYYQVDTRSNRKIEGSGLGLAITKRLVEMMDGTIDVESEYGKGSSFTVRIKQGYVSGKCIGPEVAASLQNFQFINRKRMHNAKITRVSLPYARVLVVDDVATNLDVARGMMKPYGMKIDCVSSGPEAIKLVRDNVKYNAIFMDHMMPDMDGIEAVKLIREIDSDYARTVPIIALTANAIRGNEDMFLNNGFQGFLAKPIVLGQMDAIIRRFVRDKDQEAALGIADADAENEAENEDGEVSPSVPAESKLKIEGINIEEALERFEDEETFIEVLRSYAKNTPAVLADMETLSAENLAKYGIWTHGIKGSCLGICAEKLGAQALELEREAKAGNFDFVRDRNAPFIADVRTLITAIEGAI